MSILIAAIDHLTRGVYLAADHRSMDLDGEFVSDGNTKIFTIREGIMYGMSGLSSEGLRMKEYLLDNKYLTASELIQLAENFSIKNIVHNDKTHGTTFIIAGAYDDGKPFIWSKTTYEKEPDAPEKRGEYMLDTPVGSFTRLPSLYVSAPNQSTINAVKPNFVKKVISTGSYAQAMALSIKDASNFDKAISPSLDVHVFDTGTMSGSAKTITLNLDCNGK